MIENNGFKDSRSSHPIFPGENIYADIGIIGEYSGFKFVQYSAEDEATGVRLSMLYPEKANYYSIKFLDHIVKRFPFKIKCISTRKNPCFAKVYAREPVDGIKMHPFSARCGRLLIKHLIETGFPPEIAKAMESEKLSDREFYRMHREYSFKQLVEKRKEYDELFNNKGVHIRLRGLTPLEKLRSYNDYKCIAHINS